MKSHFRSKISSVGFAVALAFASGAAVAAYSPDMDLGSAEQEGTFNRVITISPSAKWVNVNRDESIKFIDAATGRSFVWRFNTLSTRFDLARVAPSGILSGRRVDAYIGDSARESGRHF